MFTWYVDGELGHLVPSPPALSVEEQDGPEGCLSLPDLTFDTKRALSVVAKGWNMYGDPVTIEGSELLAQRAIQHETDHLDGILFIDRLDRETRKLAMKAIREASWFGEQPPPSRSPPTPRTDSDSDARRLRRNPEVAVPALDAIAESGHQLVGVVTRPDAPSGRPQAGRLAGRAACRGARRPGAQARTPRDPEFQAELKALEPDCCPVVAYGALPRARSTSPSTAG